mgnify:CR=1 FL=1
MRLQLQCFAELGERLLLLSLGGVNVAVSPQQADAPAGRNGLEIIVRPERGQRGAGLHLIGQDAHDRQRRAQRLPSVGRAGDGERLAVSGQRVFLRADLNAPIKDGKVTNDARLEATLPTLKLLLAGGARVVLASHLGRPKGKPEPKYSLAPVAARARAWLC